MRVFECLELTAFEACVYCGARDGTYFPQVPTRLSLRLVQERTNAEDMHDPVFVSHTELCRDAAEAPHSLVPVQGVYICSQ